MPYEAPPISRLRTLLRSGTRREIKRRDRKEPYVQHIFNETQMWEMQQLLDQLETTAPAVPFPFPWREQQS